MLSFPFRRLMRRRPPRKGSLVRGFRPALEALEPRDLPSLFGAPTTFGSVGTSPAAVVTGDFTSDGKNDVAVLNRVSNTVNVLVGDGSGGFTAGPSSSIGLVNHTPQLLAVGDFNNDSKLDLVVGNAQAGSTSLQVLVGDGNGNFSSGALLPLNGAPRGIAVGHFNGTSNFDIAVTVAGPGPGTGLLYFFGNGSGGFAAPTIATNTPSLGALATGDFDNDGKTDAVVANPATNSVEIVYSNGGGGFTVGTPVTLPGGATNPVSVAVGDFNGDGKLDVVTANAATNNASIFFGSGSRTVPQLTAGPNLAAGINPQSVTTGDFNGDGKADLAIANAVSNNITVYTGGSGFNLDTTYALGTSPVSVAAADFNSDGLPELVTANPGSNNASLLLNHDVAGFLVGAPPSVPAGMPFSVTVTAVDAGNNPVPGYTGIVQVTSSDGAATLPGSYQFTSADAGQHTFTNLVLQTAGPQGVSVADAVNPGLKGSAPITVLPGSPAKLSFVVQPGDAITGQNLGPVQVDVEDAFGNLVTNDNNTLIDVTFGTNAGGGTLTGTTRLMDMNGVAVFNTLSISRPGVGYTLTASAAGLSSDTSNPPVTISAPLEIEPNNTIATANPLSDNGTIAGTISSSDTDFFQLTIANTEQLTALVAAGGSPVRLSLLNSMGQLVIESAGISPTDLDAQIVQILTPGTWFLEVDSPNVSATPYTLYTTAVAALPSSQPLAPVDKPVNLVTADFNNDGIADLATITLTQGVLVYFGLGNGVFQPPAPIPVAGTAWALAVGDFNNDGNMDLAVLTQPTLAGPDQVTLLFNQGDGTFIPGGSFTTGGTGQSTLVVADFDGVNGPDIAVIHASSNTVNVLLNNGSGTLSAPIMTSGTAAAPLNFPTSLAAGDFNHDGKQDLAVITYDPTGPVAILLGNGNGTFTVQPVKYDVGTIPPPTPVSSIVAADFNGDGNLDLATANGPSNGGVSVLYGNGDGTFQSQTNYSAGTFPTTLTLADLNGDGRTDLVVGNTFANEAEVLLNTGSSFTLSGTIALGGFPMGIAAADFDRDGHVDVAAVNQGTSDITVKLQRPDGTFAAPALRVGSLPITLASADLNRDGAADLITLNAQSSNISVLLGDSTGSFSAATNYSVAGNPIDLVVGDFNGDSRSDMAVISFGTTGTLSIFLGYGDGTFASVLQTTPVNGPIFSLAVGDFNHDGKQDLAIAYQDNLTSQYEVRILDGQGNGTFTPEVAAYVLSEGPLKLIAADFNSDGWLDLAVLGPNSVTVLTNNNGTFSAAPPIAALGGADDILSADLTGDNIPDLAVLTRSSQLIVLPGMGTGAFGPAQATALAISNPTDFVAGDFNADGHLDLAVTDNSAGKMYILDGSAGGTFTQEASYYATGDGPRVPIVADFNNDNFADIAVTDDLIGDVSVFLNQRGTGLAPAGEAEVPQQATPLLGDINGDGTPDVVVRASDGAILFRPGIPGQPGKFGAAMLVNGMPGNPPQLMPARDIALIQTATGTSIAAVNDVGDVLVTYTWQSGGGFAVTPGPQVGPLVTAMAATDLTGDGLTDLVVTNSTNTAEILIQQPNGTFSVLATPPLDVGFVPSSITFISNISGGPDIAITGEVSGDVTIIRNDGGKFDRLERYRAGQGPYDLNQSPQGMGMVVSPEETAGVVAGNFGSPSGRDLITINPGTGRLDLLSGTGFGTYDNPQSLANVVSDPTAIVSGTLTTQPGAPTFFAVLSSTTDTIHVFEPNGSGSFTEVLSPNVNGILAALDAGLYPTGLSIADVNGDGKYDLLVGNSYGDVLVLYGNGDGTFQTFQGTGRSTALAAADLGGSGQDSVVVSNESASTVSLQVSPTGTSFNQGRSNGVVAPGTVQFTDLNGDGIQDMIVVNSGGDDVLVYLGLGNGQFGSAQSFSVGDDPVGLTLADVNSDGLPDLIVANQGSNDVSTLLSSGTGATWTLTSGPRLHAGAGPVSTAIADVNGDGIPDILVSNSLDNTLSVLTGVGGGFFIDAAAKTFTTGSTPGQIVVGHFTSTSSFDVVVLDTGSTSLTLFTGFSESSATNSGTTVSTGGTTPEAATTVDLSGVTDLLIVNNGSNTITLLTGGSLGVSETFTDASLVNPTDVALATDGTTFYVTEEGSDQVFTFSLEKSVAATLDEAGVAVVTVPGATPTIVSELVSTSDSPLDTVAVLFNTPGQTTTESVNPDELPPSQSVIEALPFADELAAVGPEAAVSVVFIEESGDAGAAGGGSGDEDVKVPDDGSIPTRDGPALLRFLQNLDATQADAGQDVPQAPTGTQDAAPGPFNDLIAQVFQPWQTTQPTAEAPVSAGTRETAVHAAELTPQGREEPVVVTATHEAGAAQPQGRSEIIAEASLNAAETAQSENEGHTLAILAAPLVAAYFAREREPEHVRSARWREMPW
jgi:hypothetical protein